MDKKQQMMDLWHTCFGDSDAFTQLFFDRVYKDENALIIERGGQIVSALQMLPYTLNYYDTELSVAYISGTCTLPSERGRGLMQRLIQESFEVMRSRQVALTALIPANPWLFDYYREQGYTEAFDYALETYIRPPFVQQTPDITVVPPEVTSLEQLYAYFNRKLRERTCCLLHTYDDFVTILRDLQLDGGTMLTALNNKEEPVGMAFVLPIETNLSLTDHVGKKVLVKELFYDNESIKALLLQEISQQNDVRQVTYKTLPSFPDTLPQGMARIIDTHRLIHLWKKKHPHHPISIEELEKMDIQTLTRHLLDYPNRLAYMSLMLD